MFKTEYNQVLGNMKSCKLLKLFNIDVNVFNIFVKFHIDRHPYYNLTV